MIELARHLSIHPKMLERARGVPSLFVFGKVPKHVFARLN
jgi:hypothetical protein